MKCRCSYIKKVEGTEKTLEGIAEIGGHTCYFSPSKSMSCGIWNRHLGFILTSTYVFGDLLYHGYKRELWK